MLNLNQLEELIEESREESMILDTNQKFYFQQNMQQPMDLL